MKKGFTLIELVVAVGILAMMLGFTSVIFNVSIKGSRVVNANAEIMQKLRAVTDQLDGDLRGLDKNAPLLIWFEKTSNALDDPNTRFDQIMFFVTGDFKSTQLYSNKPSNYINTPVDADKEDPTCVYKRGNAARIYYGQAQRDSVNTADVNDTPSKRILCRRRQFFTCDERIEKWPVWNVNLSDFERDPNGYMCNDRYEHDSLSLEQWTFVKENAFSRDNGVVDVVFEKRPEVKLSAPNTYHDFLSEEVASFKIQWAYWNPDNNPKDDKLRWFPCDDPEKDGLAAHSHFRINAANKFGVYFNVADHTYDGFSVNSNQWYPVDDGNLNKIIYNYKKANNNYFENDFYPKALKFTFTIYDSKGIIKDGRTFSHIVYLGE